MSELEYLDQRLDACRQRLRVRHEIVREEMTRLVNLPAYVRRHPYASLALGCGAGALVGRGVAACRGLDGAARVRRSARATLRPMLWLLRAYLLPALLADAID